MHSLTCSPHYSQSKREAVLSLHDEKRQREKWPQSWTNSRLQSLESELIMRAMHPEVLGRTLDLHRVYKVLSPFYQVCKGQRDHSWHFKYISLYPFLPSGSIWFCQHMVHSWGHIHSCKQQRIFESLCGGSSWGVHLLEYPWPKMGPHLSGMVVLFDRAHSFREDAHRAVRGKGTPA